METHSSILAWRMSWTERLGGLQAIELQRVGHEWSDLACMHTGPITLLTLLFCICDISHHKQYFKCKVIWN